MSLENFNNLVNGNLMDIEDLPDFVNPATGTYKLLSVKAELGERDASKTKSKQAEGEIVLQVQVAEVLEENPTEEQLAAVGNLASFRFYGEFGVKQFKKLFAEMSQQLNLGSVADVITHLNNGQEFGGVLNQRSMEDQNSTAVPKERKYFTDLKLATLI